MQGGVGEHSASPQEKQEVWEGVCRVGEGGREGGSGERREFFSMIAGFAWGCRENARKWRRKGVVG
jgi:hypothetical protein